MSFKVVHFCRAAHIGREKGGILGQSRSNLKETVSGDRLGFKKRCTILFCMGRDWSGYHHSLLVRLFLSRLCSGLEPAAKRSRLDSRSVKRNRFAAVLFRLSFQTNSEDSASISQASYSEVQRNGRIGVVRVMTHLEFDLLSANTGDHQSAPSA
jgi:hypothetical protein